MEVVFGRVKNGYTQGWYVVLYTRHAGAWAAEDVFWAAMANCGGG